MRIYGEHEQRVIDQLARCAAVEEGARAVLCADGHLGYSQPIGGAIAYREPPRSGSRPGRCRPPAPAAGTCSRSPPA